jgi:Fe-S oxidoreductase
VSCKGCKRECPTGVDMARMKIEFLARYKASRGHPLRDRAIAYLPRYAPWAGRLAPLANAVASMGKSFVGFSRERELPAWRGDYFEDRAREATGNGREVVLFVDTFNRWFEPGNVRAAIRVLEAAGCSVRTARPLAAGRPLCCGRTFLTAGMVDEARSEARRTLDALRPHLERGVPIIGLEPSCLFSFRDEYAVLFKDAPTEALSAGSFLLEEYLAREPGRLRLKEMKQEVLLHGHCHQKAFDAMPAVEKVLGMIPGLKVSTVQTSCCGMAGSFGYEAEHHATSMQMAEMALLPAIRKADAALVIADGTSCRHQIADGSGREALHVARVLDSALDLG